jgi:hypothetical protein
LSDLSEEEKIKLRNPQEIEGKEVTGTNNHLFRSSIWGTLLDHG